MHVKILVSSFPSDELLAQVDDSVLSKFMYDVFSSFTGFYAKTFFCGGARMQMCAKGACVRQ